MECISLARTNVPDNDHANGGDDDDDDGTDVGNDNTDDHENIAPSRVTRDTGNCSNFIS